MILGGMKMDNRLRLFGACCLAAVSVSGAAAAQSRASAAVASASNTIEELVVTAERREQNLQDVPVAVSAFTSKQRDLVGITTIQDYTNFTPGFSYSTFSDRASIRGIGRLTNIHSVDAAVAIYIDGVYTTSTVLAGGPPLEVGRVEILRGPQGTLYGRNSIGGTVNIISPRPTDEPYAEVRAIAENYDYTNLQLAASGPLADHLRVRVSGYKLDQRQGYFKNVNPGQPSEGNLRNEWEYQVQVAGELGDHADFWARYQSLGWNNRGGPGARSSYLNGPYDTAINFTPAPAIYNPAFGYGPGALPGSLQQFGGGVTTTNPALKDPRSFNTNTPIHVTLRDVHVAQFNFAYHMPTFDIRYTTGLQSYKYDLSGDADNTDVKSVQVPLAAGSICGTIHGLFSAGRSPQDCQPLTIEGTNTYHYFEDPTWYSHEIDFTSTTAGPLQWIAGLYLYHETYRASTPDPDLFTPGSAQLQHPALGAAANPSGAWNLGDYDMVTESKAAFGQLDWKATASVKFTAGLRYTRDHKFGTEFKRVVCFADTCMPGLYSAVGLNAFGPGTAANWGSLLGNFAALSQIGPFLGLGNALAPLAGLGNGGFDLTDIPDVAGGVAPTTGPKGAKGVTDPVKCAASGICTQFTIDPATGQLVRHLGDTSDAWTGTLGAQWDPREGSMAYARYSRGYKAFGLAAGSALSQPEAKPEFVNSYEIGAKQSFGRTLQLDAAVYYLDYRDLQAPLAVQVGPTTTTEFINIGKSRSTGFELDAVWQPLPPLRLSLDYSYDNTRILQSGLFVDAQDNLHRAPVSLVGNQLPQAPLNKVAVNVTYAFELDPGTLTLGASYIYRDKVYATVFSTPGDSAPSWDQVDLRANWTAKGGKYVIIGYVRNLFDTQGYDAAVAATTTSFGPYGSQNLELTPPRTYGVELQYKF
jgi:iron complex outermembrane receptor protein